MSSRSAEVLVIGAGPAGCALAARLARAGRDVLILERARFPRDKPCGDSLSPGVLAELERAGFAGRVERRLRPSRLEGWRIEAPDGAVLQVGFGSDESGRPLVGWAVRRRELDQTLLEEAIRAGARVRFGVRAFDLMREGGRVVGVVAREGTSERSFSARVCVGADGLRSVVQRRLGLAKRTARLRKVALVGHLAEPNGIGGFGELRVREGRCCGYAPCGDGANVTLVVPGEEAGRLKGSPRAFMLAALDAFPAVARRVRRSGLAVNVMVTGPFDRPLERPWAPGAVLVGDAAGYYDPFTGQGIHQALLSARLAAEAVEELLDDPTAERRALRRYARRLSWEVQPGRWVQRVIEAVVARPQVMSRFVRALDAGQGAVGMRLLRVTGDVAHAATLLSPPFWARLLYELAKAGSPIIPGNIGPSRLV